METLRPRSLSDGSVVLDEPVESDADAVVAAQDEATLAAFGEDRPNTPEKAARWIAAARRLWAEPAESFDGRWAIRRPMDPALVGWLRLHLEGDRASIRAWLAPEARGGGLGTAALTLAIGLAFDELGASVVEAHIIPANRGSRALARSLGFRITPDHITTSTDYAGMALVYELERDAWPPRHEPGDPAELAWAEAELAAYDPADHFLAVPPTPAGKLMRQHFETKRRAILEDAVEIAKRRLR